MLYKNSALMLSSFTDRFKGFLTDNEIETEKLLTDIETQERIASIINPFIFEFLKTMDTMIDIWEEDPEIAGFLEKFDETWGNCIRLLGIHLSILVELASITQKIPADEEHIKDYMLSRLLGRGIRTFQEITLLLENGYPYGASSLTRNLFELAVVAKFIETNDATVAKAYYETSNESIEHDDHYNWAKASGKFKDTEHITLKRLHELAGFKEDSYNILYKILCNFTHASSQITNREMGVVSDDVFIGPTIFGIDSAGINAIRLINEIALTIISKQADSDATLKLKLVILFGEYICKELTNVASHVYSKKSNGNLLKYKTIC